MGMSKGIGREPIFRYTIKSGIDNNFRDDQMVTYTYIYDDVTEIHLTSVARKNQIFLTVSLVLIYTSDLICVNIFHEI